MIFQVVVSQISYKGETIFLTKMVFPYVLPLLIFNVSHFISSLLPYGTMFDVFSRVNATNLLSPSVDRLDGPSNLILLALRGFFDAPKHPALLICWFVGNALVQRSTPRTLSAYLTFLCHCFWPTLLFCLFFFFVFVFLFFSRWISR